jgi:PAS domain S-box-containing protein
MKKEEIYTTINKNLPVGFSIVDEEGIIRDFNRAAEIMTGFVKKDVMGKSHIEIFHGSKNKDACPLFKHAIQEHKQKVEIEAKIREKNGELINISVTAFPLFDSKGNFVGGVELFRDITEYKKLEREHKNLLSMFAHDMKNPVLISGGFLSRLLSGKAGNLTSDQKDYLEIIKNEQSKLECLVKNFLEFSRFESKEYKPLFCPFDIGSAIREHIDSVGLEAQKKNVKVYFEYPEDSSPVIQADTAMITRAITNLLDNAIKYTDSGGSITISLLDRREDVLIQIVDTGMGIPEDQLPYIFDAFYRAERGSAGSGLGLSITKKIVEVHDGKIWVESSSGKGSTFSLILPKGLK